MMQLRFYDAAGDLLKTEIFNEEWATDHEFTIRPAPLPFDAVRCALVDERGVEVFEVPLDGLRRVALQSVSAVFKPLHQALADLADRPVLH